MQLNDQIEPHDKADASGSLFVTLKGMYLAKLWIIAPALIALPLMWLFGDGDYIVPVLGVLWILCFVGGLRIRANAPIDSVERARGFWISLWSLALAGMMVMLTISFVIDGVWR